MRYTKRGHEEWLNELEAPEADRRSNGGRIPDFCRYGSWIRRNDPIGFEVSYHEREREFSRR